MRVFVSEYVTSGAWRESEVPASLLREGSAMLCSLVSDFARIKDCEVATTWDGRKGHCPLFDEEADNIEVQVVTPPEEACAFEEQCRAADYVLVIAPEFQNLLANRCGKVEILGTELLNCSVEGIRQCTDKFTLSRLLKDHQIPTIPTRAVPNPHRLPETQLEFPLVIKPRDGAGSQDTYLISHAKDWQQFKNETQGKGQNWILQPYIAGRTLSVAAIIGEPDWNGEPWLEIFPLAEQRLTNDGRFGYLGGRIPETIHLQHIAAERVRAVASLLPRLSGYVGLDLLAPFDSPEELLVVEINPRLTTSYLGYRVLADQNLAEYLLPASRPEEPLRWKPESVRFTADGVRIEDRG
jgi:tyramine---L-glutamate ligase